MYEDLIKRLRSECALPYSTLKDMREAADVIEELSRENESLAKSMNEISDILRSRRKRNEHD